MIGSAVVTVPSAAWLWSQGGVAAEQGHAHEAHEKHTDVPEADRMMPEGQDGNGQGRGGEDEASDEEESKDEGEEKSEDNGGETEEKSEDKTEDKKEESGESKDESKSDDSASESGDEKETPPTSDDEDDEYEKPGPNAPGQINKNTRKGPGEQQKGPRPEPTLQSEKSVSPASRPSSSSLCSQF